MPRTPSPPDSFQQQVHDALTLWHKDASFGSPLDYLTAVKQEMARAGVHVRLATNRVLLAGLSALEKEREVDAALLRRRFLDDKPSFAVANELNIAEPTLFRRQRLAIRRLAEILFADELAAHRQRSLILESRAPVISRNQPVGIDLHLERLSRLLAASEPPWLVAVDGIGGIGKTTLAREVAQTLVVDRAVFADFAWISAQQQRFHPGGFIETVEGPALTVAGLVEELAGQLLPAGVLKIPFSVDDALERLQAKLRETPCLVVIDNLETLADAVALLPALRRLAGPAKLLLTTRRSLRAEDDVFCYPLPELSEAAALQLMRNEAQARNLQPVMAASDDELRPIYATVGGNALALKLVVGQLYLLPLPQVLDNLRVARGQKAEDLYRYIYLAAWRKLDAAAQEVLLAMPLFAQSGADFASVERVSEVKGGELLDALERLALLSLVNIGGNLQARRYSIHRLTETFLLTDIIGWQGGWSDA